MYDTSPPCQHTPPRLPQGWPNYVVLCQYCCLYSTPTDPPSVSLTCSHSSTEFHYISHLQLPYYNGLIIIQYLLPQCDTLQHVSLIKIHVTENRTCLLIPGIKRQSAACREETRHFYYMLFFSTHRGVWDVGGMCVSQLMAAIVACIIAIATECRVCKLSLKRMHLKPTSHLWRESWLSSPHSATTSTPHYRRESSIQ